MTLLIFALFAQDTNELPVELTYDFSHPEVMSREIISDETLSLERGLNRVLDYGLRSILEKPSDRKAFTLMTGIALGVLGNSLVSVEHELGHLQSFSRAGIGNRHFFFTNNDGKEFPASNFWQIFSKVAGKPFGNQMMGVGIDQSGWSEFYNNPDLVAHHDEFVATMEASGLNQVQYSLEKTADLIWSGKAHIFDGLGWFWRINETLLYSTSFEGSDIRDYLDDLKQLGIDSNIGHVKNIQWLKYVSGSSLAMWTGLYNFIDNGETRITPWFSTLPEFASYLSIHGPTLKIRARASSRGAGWAEPSFQFSLDDAKREEYGLKLQSREFDNCWSIGLGGFLNRSRGYWLDGNLTIAPLSWLNLGIGFSHGQGFTYEREIIGKTFSFLKEREFSLKGTIGIKVSF